MKHDTATRKSAQSKRITRGTLGSAVFKIMDEERKRQGMTKEQLARWSGMPGTSMRRLLTGRKSDAKLSTLIKIASALGATIEIKRLDSDLSVEQGRLLIARVRRMKLAERLGARSGLDASDIEHALYNLTLTSSERLARRMRHV